jgi:hypothetical protein
VKNFLRISREFVTAIRIESVRENLPDLLRILQNGDEVSKTNVDSLLQVIELLSENSWSFTYHRMPSSVFPVLKKKDFSIPFKLREFDFSNQQLLDEKTDRYKYTHMFDIHAQVVEFDRQISKEVSSENGSIGSLDFWFLHEMVLDTIHLFKEDHTICADQLLGLPIPRAHQIKFITVSMIYLIFHSFSQ